MAPDIVDYYIDSLFSGGPYHRYIFLGSDYAEMLAEILGSYSNLYVYHIAKFSGGSRRLLRPNGQCIFNPEQSVDSFGYGPNSLTAQLGFIDYDNVQKVYSLMDITQLKPRKNHEPVGMPGADLAAVLNGVPGSYKLSRIASDSIASLYNKIQDPDKKKQFKSFFKNNYNFTMPGTPMYNGWGFGGEVQPPAVTQEQMQAYASAQFHMEVKEKEVEPELKIDFVLPSKISGVVSGSTLHSIVAGFLNSLPPSAVKKGLYKLFFVVSGCHRGVVGILKNDLGTWLEIDVFDRINASRQAVLLGDCEHEPPTSLDEMEVALTVHNDKVKVAKCQAIPITYSVAA